MIMSKLSVLSAAPHLMLADTTISYLNQLGALRSTFLPWNISSVVPLSYSTAPIFALPSTVSKTTALHRVIQNILAMVYLG
jgi:predicted amidohydrolase